MTILMNSVGIKTGWRVIQGAPDFFSITKKMHNALQGGEINLTDRKKRDLRRSDLRKCHPYPPGRHDLVIIHDPQPLPMIEHYAERGPWIWQRPRGPDPAQPGAMGLLQPLRGEATTPSSSASRNTPRSSRPPRSFSCRPSILSPSKTITMSEAEMRGTARALQHPHRPAPGGAGLPVRPLERPPGGGARPSKWPGKRWTARLVLLGNVATDDPEGPEVYESLLESQEERIIILSAPGHRPGQRLAEPGRRRLAEIPPGGLRPDRSRGHVEGDAGHRRQRRAASATRSRTASTAFWSIRWRRPRLASFNWSRMKPCAGGWERPAGKPCGKNSC